MAVSDRDGMGPVSYLTALADNPEVALEKGTLDYLAQRYGHDPGYVDYYQKSGLDVVPEVIDAQLAGMSSDFATATPEQIAQAACELQALAAPTEHPAGHEAYPHQDKGMDKSAADPTAQATQAMTDDQILQELAAALGQDASAEIARSKTEFFAYLTQQLWQGVRAELDAEVQAQVAEQKWTSVGEAKSAAYEPAYNALIAAIEGFWNAGAEAGGFAPLLGRSQ